MFTQQLLCFCCLKCWKYNSPGLPDTYIPLCGRAKENKYGSVSYKTMEKKYIFKTMESSILTINALREINTMGCVRKLFYLE